MFLFALLRLWSSRRYRFMRVELLYAILLMIRNATSTPPPHIIIILADDLGFDDVSFRGSNEFLTPNIDALAYNGRILEKYYTPSFGTASRATLLTGRYPIHTGMQHKEIAPDGPWGLPTNITTMADIFQRSGYSTNLVGKWHLGHARKEFTPTYRGFDYHYGFWGDHIHYYSRRIALPFANTSFGYDFRRNMAIECSMPDIYVTDLLTAESERIIDQHSKKPRSGASGKPLFLLVSHLAVHIGSHLDPLQAPTEIVAKYAHIRDPQRRKYAAMVDKLDESVGRIVTALNRADMLQDSIVLFCSDNGAPATGTWSNAGSNYPLRGQKDSPWEGGVRVPAAIWSGRLQQRSSSYPKAFYVGDWLPTLAAAAGIDLTTFDLQLDGLDMWPALASANDPIGDKREILLALDDINHSVGFLRGQWKYLNGTGRDVHANNVLRLREEKNFDPRSDKYAQTILSSQVGEILRQHQLVAGDLSEVHLLTLRRDTEIHCGLDQRSCNPLLEDCLFNLERDPCEANNLARFEQHADILDSMRHQIRRLRRSAWWPAYRRGVPDANPATHDCTWTNFADQPEKENIECQRFSGRPCETDL